MACPRVGGEKKPSESSSFVLTAPSAFHSSVCAVCTPSLDCCLIGMTHPKGWHADDGQLELFGYEQARAPWPSTSQHLLLEADSLPLLIRMHEPVFYMHASFA
eukprot:1161607-Pelagomonas_calceolata.AAC.3